MVLNYYAWILKFAERLKLKFNETLILLRGKNVSGNMHMFILILKF